MKRGAPVAPCQTPADEPTRLGRDQSDTATVLKTYAAWTRPGERAGVAAWYRLADQLDDHVPGDNRSATTRWPRTWVLSAALTAAFGLFLLVRAAPALPPTPLHGGGDGLGGASGEAEAPGAGGTRGASGAQGSGGTAAIGAVPRRAG